MDNIKNKKEKQQNSVPDGQVGIRTTLNKMGFSDDKRRERSPLTGKIL